MDPLYQRLSFYCELDAKERDTLRNLELRERSYGPGENILRRGDTPDHVFAIKEGWAVRYVTLEDGRTQILNFMMPGDIFDLQVFLASEADHSVSAVTRVVTSVVDAGTILQLFGQGSPIAAAMWWATVQEEGILREQIVRNGRRSARERVAHLLLELHRRAGIVGNGDQDSFYLPISQILIADSLGLSFVHVNRVLRTLEKEGYISRSRSTLTLENRRGLIDIAGYSEEHLHLDAPPRRLSFMAVAE